MIYNKPHDYSWKLLPSLNNRDTKKELKHSSTDNLILNTQAVEISAPVKKNVDIILDGKPTFVKNLEVDENTIIDLTAMPVIEGIPILRFPDEPYKENTNNVFELIKPEEQKEEVKKEVKAKKSKNTFLLPKKSHILKIASFFILLYFGTFVAFMLPLRPTYSETEKRELSKFPEFSFNALKSGDYFDDISSWFSDTFPFRDSLTAINSSIKELHGFNTVVIHGEIDSGDEIPDAPMDFDTDMGTDNSVVIPENNIPPVTEEVTIAPPSNEELNSGGNKDDPAPNIPTQSLGAVIVAGDSAYEYYSFSSSLAARYINCINTIDSKAKPKNNVYSIVVPTSIDVTLNDSIRAEVNSSNQQKALDYINGSTKNAIAVNSVFNTLRLHRNEYIYFRTDHHWTALGAYYAYSDFCKASGKTPVALSKHETVTYKNFTGTFFTNAGQSSTLKENADSVITYQPYNKTECLITKTDGTQYKWDIVADVTDYGSTLKYLAFIGGDNPLTTITNKDNKSGKTCIVIKDSYGNAFVPFLVPHYSTIYVIDPRHYQSSLASFAQGKTIDDVIFISNMSTTRNEVFIKSLENLVR